MVKYNIMNKCKTTLAVILVLVILSAIIAPVNAQENLSLNYESAEIYVLDEDLSDAIGEIPSEYPASVQLEVNTFSDSVKWYVSEGESVTVDQNGLVTPCTQTWYWYDNVGTTAPPQDDQVPARIDVDYITGESTVTCEINGVSVSTVVNVIEYSDIYVDEKIQNYIETNITDSMTDYEKLEKVCQYVANFNYSAKHSGYNTMVIYGSGDCWASTGLVNYMCNKYLGIEAEVRYGANDYGAGSGHRNSVICIDDVYYEVEVGYDMSAPRYYNIKELFCGFSFHSNDNGYTIYQYDGKEKDVVIPALYGSTPVTGIGETIFYYNSWEKYTPSSISIPASISTIDELAFCDLDALKNFYVDKDNLVFTSVDGVIYSKDKKTLFLSPSGKEGTFTIPEGTKKIGDYALYYSSKITEIIVPEGVSHIGFGSFGDCENLSKVVLPESIQFIDDFAFYNNNNLTEIYIPKSVTKMGDTIFSDTNNITIFGEDNSYAQEYALDKKIRFVVKKDGDVNLDGKIAITDATAIQKFLAEITEFSFMQKTIADFDKDERITVKDATSIQKMLAGLEY